MPEWFDNFFGGLYGRVLAGQFTRETTANHVRIVRRTLRLRKGQRVLDVPCGMGRMTLPLARAGLAMTGVDLTPAYIRKAKRLAGKRRNLRFIACDMRRMEFDREFDAAFNWFTSIGYFSDADELEFCRRVFRALRPGGKFLVETINGTWLHAHFEPHHDEQTIGGVRVKQDYLGYGRGGRMKFLWTFRKGRTVERRTLSIKHYSGPELRALLKKAGFRDVVLFDGRSLGRLTRGSRRLLAVGTRPR